MIVPPWLTHRHTDRQLLTGCTISSASQLSKKKQNFVTFSLLSISLYVSDDACHAKSVLTSCQNFQRVVESERQWITKTEDGHAHDRYRIHRIIVVCLNITLEN